MCNATIDSYTHDLPVYEVAREGAGEKKEEPVPCQQQEDRDECRGYCLGQHPL